MMTRRTNTLFFLYRNAEKTSNVAIAPLVTLETNEKLQSAISENKSYICAEILGDDIRFESRNGEAILTDIETEGDTKIWVEKI